MRPLEVLIGAGPLDWATVEPHLLVASRLIAVDGGANHCAAASVTPDTIVGDLDSVTDLRHWQAQQGVTITQIDEQNSTDFEKALGQASPAAVQLCFGFTGGRFDQTLAALHALVAFPSHRVVLVSEQDVSVLLPLGTTRWTSEVGARLSLFPLTACEFTRSTGLRYPLAPLTLELGTRIGTSNQVTAPEVSVSLETGTCLLIQPLSAVEHLLV